MKVLETAREFVVVLSHRSEVRVGMRVESGHVSEKPAR